LPESITNRERVGRALDLLKHGLAPFVEQNMRARYRQKWLEQVRSSLSATQKRNFHVRDEGPEWDSAQLLSVMRNQWDAIFKNEFGRTEPRVRRLVNELCEVRVDWAHQKVFSAEDAYRAVDSVERLLIAVSALPQADEARTIKSQLFEHVRATLDAASANEAQRTSTTLRDFGFSETQERKIMEIVEPLQELGMTSIDIEKQGGGDVSVVGELDAGTTKARRNGLFGRWDGKRYQWFVYSKNKGAD